MALQPLPPDPSSFWMWVGGLLATGVVTLFSLAFGITNSRVTEVRTEAKADLEAALKALSATIDARFAGASVELTELRRIAADASTQHLAMLRELRELPRRDEMKHDLEVMETRLTDRIDQLQQGDK